MINRAILPSATISAVSSVDPLASMMEVLKNPEMADALFAALSPLFF